MRNNLEYENSLDGEKTILDSKLIYLTLLEEDALRFHQIKSICFLSQNSKVYANLRFLAKQKLIHPHPLLTSDKSPNKEEMKRAGGLYIQVLDRSYKALLWATGDYLHMDELALKSESQCFKELKRVAGDSHDSIMTHFKMRMHYDLLGE